MGGSSFSLPCMYFWGRPPSVDGIWLWVYCNKLPDTLDSIYLSGDYRVWGSGFRSE